MRLRGLLLVALLGVAPLAVSCSRSDANDAAKPRTAVTSENKVDKKKVGKDELATTSDSSDGPETSSASDGATAGKGNESGSSTSGSTTESSANATAGDPRGSIHQVEPPKDGAGELTPVDLDSTAKFGSGVTVRLKSITATTAKAVLPGEISGPAVRVTVELTNSTATPLNLDNVAVELITMTGTPAGLITSSDAVPFKGNAASGATSTGTYVFSVDPAKRETARLSIKYSANTPTAIFTGSLPHG
ncbi:MAG: hypothetical protein WBF71_02215 [Microthrixaceae bacterium]